MITNLAESQETHVQGEVIGGFDFTPLIGEINNYPRAVRELVYAYPISFVAAAGRQYVQVFDVHILAALAVDVYPDLSDWDGITDDTLTSDIAAWPLPGGHTGAPARTPGQVAGIYRFWWELLRDAVTMRLTDGDVPSAHEIEHQMSAAGVRLYVTSSTTWEELAGIHRAFDVVRELGPDATAQELVTASLPARLAAELHWQTWRRHARRAHGEHDPHASVLGMFLPKALARPCHRRRLYDRLWAIVAAELRQARGRTAALYAETIAAYNANHPDRPLKSLHSLHA